MTPDSDGRDKTYPAPETVQVTATERVVTAELTRVDAHLGGMFVHGLQIQNDVYSPGIAFILGSITREIANGVIRHLAEGGSVELSAEEIQELQDKNEGHRASIAEMLGLSVNHPSVDGWFQFTGSLHRLAHYKSGPVNSDAARTAFDDLKKFMFTQLGGYFDTRAEIDTLLSIPIPPERALDLLKRLLSRPAQRRHFYSRLAHPGWVIPLLEQGYLPNAPEMPRAAFSETRFPPWFEGEYLLHAATARPDDVTTALERIPTTNEHPYVWRTVAQVACSLPPPYASRIATHLRDHYKRRPPHGVYDHAIALVAKLASHDADVSLSLVSTLLVVRAATPVSADEDSLWKPVPWPFEGLNQSDFERLVEKAFPQLTRVSPIAVLQCVLSLLNQCIVVARKEGHTDTSSYSIGSMYGKRSSYDHDPRASLAYAAVEAIRAIGVDRRGLLRRALSEVNDFDSSDIFHRLKLVLFNEYPWEFRTEIAELFCDPTFVDPPYGAVEVAQLLRTAFEVVDAPAREQFAQRVNLGPDPTRYRNIEGDKRFANEWKCTRIRWFHDRIPSELQLLASSLAVSPAVPTPRQQSLDETGFYIGPVTSGEPLSTPKSTDELTAMSDLQIAAFLQQYDSSTETPDHTSGMTMDGLPAAVSDFARLHPARALETFNAILQEVTPAAHYVASLLSGLEKVPEFGPSALSVVPAVATATLRFVRGATVVTRRHWRWAIGSCVEILTDVCNADRVAVDDDTLISAWGALDALIETCDVVEPDDDEGNPGFRQDGEPLFDDVITQGMTNATGT